MNFKINFIGYNKRIVWLVNCYSIFHWLFSDLGSFAGTQIVGS